MNEPSYHHIDTSASTVNEFDKQEFNGRSTPDTEDTNTESETEGTWGAIMNEPSYHHIDTSAEISISMPTRQPVTRGDSTPDPPGLQTFQSHMEDIKQDECSVEPNPGGAADA